MLGHQGGSQGREVPHHLHPPPSEDVNSSSPPSESSPLELGKEAADDHSIKHWILQHEVFVIITVCTVSLVIVCLLIVCFVVARRRRNRRKDKLWEADEIPETVKSAPISRQSSPKLSKRKSYPDATAMYSGMMIRSMTTDSIPDFTLPPERVQPRNHKDRSYSLSAAPTQSFLLGSLQPDLYQGYETDDENVFYLPPTDHGRLWFTAVYDAAAEELHVTLVKVRDLRGRGRDNVARDPYVKVFLLPDERNCKISKVKKKTLSPIYNEVFIFQVSPDDIAERVVRFSVYDVDKRRVRHSLGHVLVPLRDFDMTKGELQWKDLENNSKISTTLGELNFSLNYLPHMDKVKVIVHNARNLRQINYDKDTGLYVRVQMLHGRKVSKTKKTLVQRASCDPSFNESFSFNVSGKMLDSFSFDLTIMKTTKSPLANDEPYGRVVIGSFMFSRGEELLHWQEMLSNIRKPVNRWHALTGVNVS